MRNVISQGIKRAYYRFRAWLGRPKIVTKLQPVPVRGDEVCATPIFLIGTHRSGTSLMRRVVNAHTAIACPPESFFMSYFFTMLDDKKVRSGFEGLGYPNSQIENEIGVWASRYHEIFRLGQNKARWADKTPQYVLHINEIERMFSGRAQYIMIYRHPLDVLTSLSERGWALMGDGGDLWAENLEYIKKALRRQIRFEENNPEKCIRVHYERLTRQPRLVIKEITDFLNEPYQEAMIDFNSADQGFGIEDPVVRGLNEFQSNSGNWGVQSKERIDQVIESVGDEMRLLGYQVDVNEPLRV